ncbi:hypothetical protein BIW11_09985 [Tropilaelaps mercedesae]|uniref:C2H2-type domain-containing protein n=1 Tax=Tropilaelaps mercedesae TaxID=418985 RepID=A0A1V9XI10_9ACAR|nr:hypothetical protein BIW11_09985 [Tropilaelaps mercedesae]
MEAGSQTGVREDSLMLSRKRNNNLELPGFAGVRKMVAEPPTFEPPRKKGSCIRSPQVGTIEEEGLMACPRDAHLTVNNNNNNDNGNGTNSMTSSNQTAVSSLDQTPYEDPQRHQSTYMTQQSTSYNSTQVGASGLFPVQRLVNPGSFQDPPVVSVSSSSHLPVEGGQSPCLPDTRPRSLTFDQQPFSVEYDRRYSLVEGESPTALLRGPTPSAGRGDQPMDLRVVSTRARRLEILPGGIVSQPLQPFATRDLRESHPVMLPMGSVASGLQGLTHGDLSVSKQFTAETHETIMGICATYGQGKLGENGQELQSPPMSSLGHSQGHAHSHSPMSSLTFGGPMGPNCVVGALVVPKQEYAPSPDEREASHGQPSMSHSLHIPGHNGGLMWSQGPAASSTGGSPLGPAVGTSVGVVQDGQHEGRDGAGPTVARGGGAGGGEEGKCVCNICHKSFPKVSQLRMHVNIHYFERPFRCDACAVSFRTRGHLQKHKRSVSHYNRVNMNLTFGTPTADNPRPFKCDDCKIAFRIHGHLAKHLRSKMHIMKLECLGKLPFGMYAELERSGVNLNEIDTTDCENSLESLQVLAQRLYQHEACSLRWKDVSGSSEGGGGSEPEDDGLEAPLPPMQQALGITSADMAIPQNIDAINEHAMQAMRQTSPQQHVYSRMDSQPTPSAGSIANQLNQMNHGHNQLSSMGGLTQHSMALHDPQGSHGPQVPSHSGMGLGPTHEYHNSSQQQIMPQQGLVNPLMLNNMLHQQQQPRQQSSAPHGPPSTSQAISHNVAPLVPPSERLKNHPGAQLHPDAPRSSCTCHLCGKVLKSAKSLQVHLHTEHADEQSNTLAPSVEPNSIAHRTQSYVSLGSRVPHQPRLPPSARPPSLNETMQQESAHINNMATSGSAGCQLCNKSFQNHMLLQQHFIAYHQTFS